MYLPFARSCVAKLCKLGLPYADQKFEVDGVSIKVRIEPGHEYIRIEGGGNSYEFLAADAGYTELPNGTIGMEGAESMLAPGSPFCTGSGVRYKSTPVFSQSLTDTEDPPRWPKVTIDDVLTHGSLSGEVAKGTFYTFGSRPNQSFQIRHWWYNNKLEHLVASVCATGNGRTWVDWRGRLYSASLDLTYRVDAESKYGPSRIRKVDTYYSGSSVPVVTFNPPYGRGLSRPGVGLRGYAFLSNEPQFIYLKASPIVEYSWSYNTSDAYSATILPVRARYDYSAARRTIPALYYEGEELFDIVPGAYTPEHIYLGGTQRTPKANWRHTAVHVAKDREGKEHSFFVSTDTHGVFTFYPVKDYFAEGYEERNIPGELTKVVRVEYPDWVSVQPDNVSTTHDHWQWNFNKNATRACTTPLHQEDYYIYLMLYDVPSGPYGREVGVVLPVASDGRELNLSTLGATNISVHRLKVFRRKEGSTYDASELRTFLAFEGYQTGPITYGVEYLGKIIPISFAGTKYQVFDFNTFVGMDPTQMEPEKLTMPGFVEVTITIDVNESDGVVEFTPSVTVTDAEKYDDAHTLFMDCDYYVKAPRGSRPLASTGDLLTSEIEVLCGPNPPAPWAIGDVKHTPTGTLEDIALGRLALQDVYVFYTIRKRSDKSVVMRLALMREGRFTHGCIYEDDYISYEADSFLNKSCFFGMVEQADLRFLSFMTMSYSRRAGLMPLPKVTALEAGSDDLAPGIMIEDPIARTRILPHLLRPRFELRIGNAPVKTIDYSRPEVTGFGTDPEIPVLDPMTDSAVPEGVVDMSGDPAFKASCLAIKHYFARHHVRPTNNDTFSFSPDGSWSVYADRRSANMTPRSEAPDLVTDAMPMSERSTELSGVFDIVAPKNGKVTSHKDLFNKAFDQIRDYSFYDQHTWDMGGFGRCGIWIAKQE